MKSLLVALALGVSAIPAHADISLSISANLPGQPVDSVGVFYDQLAPYGMWIDDPDAGTVFMPSDAGFVPYRNGHWEYTDVGLVWISSEPFSWATSHYGRWWFSDRYDRWVWLPDTTWGPSWVTWSATTDDYGWAPMAPQFVIDAGYSVPLAAWHYCPAERIVDVNVASYYVPAARVSYIHREARPVDAFATVGSSRVVVGPSVDQLRAHRVSVQPRALTARTVGRMSASELQSATTRAQERRPQIERENQRRIEAAPTNVRQAVRAPAQLAPAANQKRPGTPEMRPQTRTEAQPQTRAPTVPQTQPRTPTRTEPQPKPEPRAVEPKPQPQPKTRTIEPRTQPQPQTQTRTIEPRTQPQPQTRTQPKPEPRAQPQPQPKPEPRAVEQRPQPQPQQRPQPQPQPQPKPEPRAQPQPQPHAQPAPHEQPRPAPQRKKDEAH
jgi:hypothetical protein